MYQRQERLLLRRPTRQGLHSPKRTQEYQKERSRERMCTLNRHITRQERTYTISKLQFSPTQDRHHHAITKDQLQHRRQHIRHRRPSQVTPQESKYQTLRSTTPNERTAYRLHQGLPTKRTKTNNNNSKLRRGLHQPSSPVHTGATLHHIKRQ